MRLLKDCRQNLFVIPPTDRTLCLPENREEHKKIVKRLGNTFVCPICKIKKHVKMKCTDGVCTACNN